jgi:DNA polymerase-3 subunit gamma/tau
MTTTVLARKYRPASFEAMVGQGHVVQALTNALTQQRLHHAYLFTGTRGVGKTTVSRILAKSLNCTGPDGQGGITATPCGQCQPCRDIDAGRFVDYLELDAASNRGVDEISQLLDQAVYKPVVGRFKVYMIDEVHMLSNTAFNAMLKTLEEPPDYLKFVLATTDPQKVPVTVLSRCLQFNLRPMAAQTVQLHLAQVLDHEGIAHDPGALRLLSRAARGSMRDAMSLADQAIAFGGGALQETSVRHMLGSVDRQHVQRIIEAVAAGDGAGLVAAVDTLRGLGLSAAGTLEDLAAGLQRMAVVQAVPSVAETSDETDPDAQTWAQLAPLLAPDETQLFYSLCLQGRAELALAPDEYSGLLMLLLRLLAFKPPHRPSNGGGGRPKAEGSVVHLAATEPVKPHSAPRAVMRSAPRAPQLQAAAEASTAPVTPAAPWHEEPAAPPGAALGSERAPEGGVSRPAAGASAPWEDGPPPGFDDGWGVDAVASLSEPAPAAAPDPLSDRWAAIVADMQSRGLITALVRELAVQSQCVAQGNEQGVSVWHLQVPRASLCGETHKDRLSQAMAEALGCDVRLVVAQGEASNTPAQRDLAAREAQQHAAQALIEGDALVRVLLAQHPGARIVPGSVSPI